MAFALDWLAMPTLTPLCRPVLFDPDTCQLVRPDGTRGPRLAGKSLAFLEALARRPGVVVRRLCVHSLRAGCGNRVTASSSEHSADCNGASRSVA